MRLSRRRLGLSTRAVHGTPPAPGAHTPVTTPIVQSSTFTNEVGAAEEVLYTRYGNNPNQRSLAQRLAALDGGEAAIAVASGMGATALAHLSILNPGDHLIACDWIYAGSNARFGQPEVKLGLIPGFGGTSRLVRRVGIAWAKELVLSGEPIDAETAQRIGLVNRVFEPDALLDAAIAAGEAVAERAPSRRAQRAKARKWAPRVASPSA